MDALRGLVLTSLVLAATTTRAGGLAHSEHFVVIAADKELAPAVLAKAEELRKSLAIEWLGAELPAWPGRVMIHAELSDQEDRGRTYVDSADQREFHVVWLNTSRQRALGSTLAHEMTHVVLASRYRGRLPAWADEGAASLQDDPARREIRRRTLDWMAKSGNWPNLMGLLTKQAVDVTDERAYSMAVSLTEFFLARGDKPRFLEFAAAAQERGLNAALPEYYRIASVAELQVAWQDWVTAESSLSAVRGRESGVRRQK
jgi:hypothetical protein